MLVISAVAIPPKHKALPFILALHVIKIGEGGHRPCIQTFAADQFDDDIPEEKAVKSSFFNWWYLGNVLVNDEEGGGERWGRRRRMVRNLLVNGGEDIGDGGKSNGDSRMKSEIQEE
ncbi:major facilitator superfamily protein [Artemisia annua]|uniref:Major facilitator superfamily protein n=1 Tax=Artemisia annua TaxID=35608 RepID=A0A2U1N866_ARTAN|nr:major facilitator superfamily protein [Artemisia annua]